jgi:hypothetical protein
MKRFPSWIRILRRLLLGLAVAATIAAAAWIEEDLRGERAWRQFESACANEGMPLDYGFYRPAPVPDSQNLFCAPILAQFSISRDPDGAFAAAYEREKPLPLELMKIMGHWQRAQPTDFAPVFEILKNALPPNPIRDPRVAAHLVLDSLRKIQNDLDALGDEAMRRPDSQIEFRADGHFTPPFSILRHFTQALTLRASAELELGRNDDAYRDVYASFRLAEGAVTFPSFIHLLMANVLGTLTLQPYWEGCARGAWSEPQLRTIGDLLSRFHPLRELPAALAASRAEGALNYKVGALRPAWMPQGWWKLNIVEFFRPKTGGGSFWSFDPAAEQIDVGMIDRSSAYLLALKHSRSPFTWLTRNEALPHQVPLLLGFAQNSFVLGRTASVLECYRLENARYPSELAQLVPAFLAAVPRDVIDGRPLRYACADGAHFKLYSVGLNGVDDNGMLPGDTDSAKGTSSPWSSRQGDWVWPQAPAK